MSKFSAMVEARRKQGIKKPVKKPPTWLFPANSEKKYDRVLYSLVGTLRKLIKENLNPQIPMMIDEVESRTPQDRQDDYLTRLKSIMLFIRGAIQPKLIQTKKEAEKIGVDVAIFNKAQSEKLNNSIFGFDLFVDEPWLMDQLRLFTSQNNQLIESLVDKEIERVEQDVERGFQQGSRFTDIAKELTKSYGITFRHARLIARDQVTKLNSSLTRLRQEEVGVTHYIWQTSDDERVRPTHKANEGKTFSWDKPPAKTGHPGHDVNCRCVAIPILDNILNLK